MNDKISKHLVTINLRYSATASSLKALAFADLAMKALFLADKPKTIEELVKGVAEIIGKNVSKELIEQGLEELWNDKKVKNINEKWELLITTRKQIEKDIKDMDSNLRAILERHFPKDIDNGILLDWFNEASIDFFEYNSDEVIKSVCKNIKIGLSESQTIEELLKKSINKYKLEDHKQVLEDSFQSFLSSENINDQQYFMNLVFAMFSARLVAADIGADPIVIDELRNATFILDTNFLFTLVLEKDELSVSLEALGSALKVIGTKLVFIHETKEEYEGTLTGKRDKVIQLFNIYPEEIVTGAEDDFIATAIKRGCVNRDDFERFFQSLQKIPNSVLGGPPIKYRDDRVIDSIVREAKLDRNLKIAIQRFCLESRPIGDKKSEFALNHDSALIHLVEKNRIKNRKTFVLSLDKTLQRCSTERAGVHGMPTVICLEGLIQILAVNSAGPEMNASDFAPLLANIIIKRCTPPKETYTHQDLYWLYSIKEDVADFPPEKIREIVKVVTKARFSGKSMNDKKLGRTINRMYQKGVKELDQALLDAKKLTKSAESGRIKEKEKRERLEKQLLAMKVKEIKKNAKRSLIKQLIWRVPASAVLAIIVFILVLNSIPEVSILGIVSSAFTFIISIVIFIKNPIKDYKQKIIKAGGFGSKILD